MKYNVYNDWPRKNVIFTDFTPSMIDGEEFQKIVKLLSEKVPDDVDYIVSPEARGFIWGSAVANHLGKGFIPLRKKRKLPEDAVMASYDYKTEYSVDTLEIPKCSIKNSKCFFVDDVLATGGTFKAAKVLIDTLNANLIGGVVIYNIGLKDIVRVKHLYFAELPLKK